ncbi:MAG: YihY/virulence factor BrkB family protein [Desulfobacca sp.]|uniref:YihY/virulence factor BrkB family protein n=1 Tax=Desulfobacca sp. TaxID=2067990 RepID=UPI004049B13F
MGTKLLAVGRQLWQLLRDTAMAWSEDNVPVLGAALAFYTLFSMAPLLILITVVVGYFLGRETVQADMVVRLGEYVGLEHAQNLMTVIQNTYKPGSGTLATMIAIGLILFGSTTVFLMLRSALDQMWGIQGGSAGVWGLIRDRGKSLLAVLLVGLLILVSIILRSLLAAFYTRVDDFLVIPGLAISLIDHGLNLAFLTALFTILYKVLPSARVPWGFAARGGLVSAVLFSVGNLGLGLYLNRQTLASAYGAAGSLVVILLWVFYSAQIIFVGAEFTQVYARHRGQESAALESPPPPS